MQNITQNKSVQRKTLIKEIQYLTIFIPAFIIISVQLVSLWIISDSMLQDLQKKAQITLGQTRDFLEEPLYNLDNAQVIRIGEVLLSSGLISGMYLESTASDVLIDKPPLKESKALPPLQTDIYYNKLLIGKVILYYNDNEIIRTRALLGLIAGITVLAVILANLMANRFIIRARIQKPLNAIVSGIDTIAAGKYGTLIQETDYSDVNLLIGMMNDMTSKIQMKSMELQDSNNLLELRVLERTERLENSIRELHQAQDLLIESEKLTALGQLSAGLAHELNTPLGAILSSNRTMIEFLDNKQRALIDFLPALEGSQRLLFERILEYGMKRSVILEFPSTSLKEKRELSSLLEKSGVPNSRNVAEALLDIGIPDKLPELLEVLRTGKNIEIIEIANASVIARRMAEIVDVGTKKAASVIAALRSYLEPDIQGEGQVVDIVKDLENVLVLMHNMLKYGIKIKREFSEIHVFGSSDKLSQVWINLIRNAAQAMEFKGTMVLRTGTKDGKVFVSVIDTGSGIPDEIKDRIFDPFFTTKKKGEGMGLGLDICRRILEAHGGSISFNSRPGHTEFRVVLPEIASGETVIS